MAFLSKNTYTFREDYALTQKPTEIPTPQDDSSTPVLSSTTVIILGKTSP